MYRVTVVSVQLGQVQTFVRSSVHPSVHSFVCSFVRLLARSFIRSVDRLIVLSFVRTFVRLIVRSCVTSLYRSFFRLLVRWIFRTLIYMKKRARIAQWHRSLRCWNLAPAALVWFCPGKTLNFHRAFLVAVVQENCQSNITPGEKLAMD